VVALLIVGRALCVDCIAKTSLARIGTTIALTRTVDRCRVCNGCSLGATGVTSQRSPAVAVVAGGHAVDDEPGGSVVLKCSSRPSNGAARWPIRAAKGRCATR
jgi:hypothetical protein